MIETFIICGLVAWYHVPCIIFNINHDNPSGLLVTNPDGKWISFGANSQVINGYGVINLFSNSTEKDACGNSFLEHELQRFHQNRWDFGFCN